MDQEQAFETMKKTCIAYAQHLKDTHLVIAEVMTAYQSYMVTADEIERSVECLETLEEIKHLLNRRTKRVCTFFPLNLPVYSLVLFAVIPSLIADEVYLRPPQKMIPIFEKLLPSLGLAEFFPNIHVSVAEREVFVRDFVADSDVTIFTGKESNARHVLSKTKKDSLFLFNGWGCNPIVVASDADVELAIAKAAEAKLFNAGQDCAGPDNILIHRDVADQFIARLQLEVDQAKVGDYQDPEVVVGRIAEESALVRLASFLLKHQDGIIYGGNIDFAKSIVYPTMIAADLADQTNYEEFFSPIFYLNTYDNDSQLDKYFGDQRYAANNMYVSLFGTSDYVTNMKQSIVYQEQTILDVERGNSAYGGYSFGASFVATDGKIEARPILIAKEMSNFLAAKTTNLAAPQKLSAAVQKRIPQDVATAIQAHFGTNLIFGFVFGSIAKGRATTSSDIDIMIVVKDDIPSQKTSFLEWSKTYHESSNLKYDQIYPLEYVTQPALDAALTNLNSVFVDIATITSTTFDTIFWAQVLCGIKRGMTGDEKLIQEYAKRMGRFPKKWRDQMVSQLEDIAAKVDDEDTNLSLEVVRKMRPDEVQKWFVAPKFLSEEQRKKQMEQLCAIAGFGVERLFTGRNGGEGEVEEELE